MHQSLLRARYLTIFPHKPPLLLWILSFPLLHFFHCHVSNLLNSLPPSKLLLGPPYPSWTLLFLVLSKLHTSFSRLFSHRYQHLFQTSSHLLISSLLQNCFSALLIPLEPCIFSCFLSCTLLCLIYLVIGINVCSRLLHSPYLPSKAQLSCIIFPLFGGPSLWRTTGLWY